MPRFPTDYTLKSAPVNADKIMIADSASSDANKYATLESISPDLYKYTISRTVDGSGNITITLLNYLGATPSASAPVKVQIGDTVRTITSALSTGVTTGANYFNAGSSELATKEIDYFTYLFYCTTDAVVRIGISRFPSFNNCGEVPTFATINEKTLYGNGTNTVATDPVTNIGCFNAILSAGSGYTWSIPATSVIINRPIYETRWLDFVPQITVSGSMTYTSISYDKAKYRISSNKIDINCHFTGTTGGSASNQILFTLPFSRVNSDGYETLGSCTAYDNADFIPLCIFNSSSTTQVINSKLGGNYVLTAGTTLRNKGFYEI